MNQRPRRCVAEPWISQGAWPLDADWMAWVLEEAGRRGVHLVGVCREVGWCRCPPEDWLTHDGSLEAWIDQRPGCGGAITTLTFMDDDGPCGAWIEERRLGEAESSQWRSVLMEALVLAGRERRHGHGGGSR